MNRSIAVAMLAVTTVLIASCGSSGPVVSPPPPQPSADVYLAGLALTTIPNNPYSAILHAAYWKNGNFISLPDEGGSAANSMALVGSDVHVIGIQFDYLGDTATDWINGSPTALQDNGLYSDAYGAASDGSNIYIAGVSYSASHDVQNAMYWKNGTAVHLPTTNVPLEAWNVAVAGGHVYVTGNEQLGSAGSAAVYWVDGVEHILTNNGLSSTATGIVIDGSDVYIAGAVCVASDPTCNTHSFYWDSNPAYWKNGVQTTFSGVGFITSIAVANGHVYCTGYSSAINNGSGVYWVDGVATAYSGNGPTPGQIVVQGENVYTAGDTVDSNSFQQGGYWFNNVFTEISAAGSHPGVSAIIVVPKPASEQ
jgi:hypothetical protein